MKADVKIFDARQIAREETKTRGRRGRGRKEALACKLYDSAEWGSQTRAWLCMISVVVETLKLCENSLLLHIVVNVVRQSARYSHSVRAKHGDNNNTYRALKGQ